MKRTDKAHAVNRHQLLKEVLVRKTFPSTLFAILTSLPLLAQVGAPVANWTVPPYQTSSAPGGLTIMTDISGPRPFIPVQPCRLVDTRAGSGFPAGYGPPSLAPGVQRSFDLDNGPCPGLPLGIEAYSLNITVVSPTGPGHLVIYPTGGSQPDVSSINYVAGQTIANAAIVPAGTGGGVVVVAAVSGTNLLIDINGYFSDTLGSPGNFFRLENNSEFQVMELRNFSTTCTADCGLVSRVDSNANASAVLGHYTGGGPGAGISGTSLGNIDSAGVRGSGLGTGAGVEGTSLLGYGVIGATEAQNVLPGHAAVGGFLRNVGASTVAAAGYLGRRTCINIPIVGLVCSNTGVSSFGNAFVDGNLNVTGTKSFIEPMAGDPNKMINYVALEGPEAGTYFRGRGRFERGMARITSPDHFREVTDPQSLSVQITPIGGMATVGVLRVGLDEIVVQSSRNLEFYYMVNGVRRAYRDHPVVQHSEFQPQSADARMPGHYPPEIRQRLVAAGVYNADGTVNMETAERLGWTRAWAEAEANRAELAAHAGREESPGRRD